MFPGNLFVYFKFHNIKYIDVETRKSILIVLAGIISIGVIIIGLARPPHRTSTFDANLDEHLSHKKRGPIQALKKLWTTFFLKEVVALYFIYGATGNFHLTMSVLRILFLALAGVQYIIVIDSFTLKVMPKEGYSCRREMFLARNVRNFVGYSTS